MRDRKSSELADRKADLRYWQRLLRLQDHDISLKVVRFHEDMRDTVGCCEQHPEHKSARITLRSQQDLDYVPLTPNDPHDQEATLVHELLHIWIKPFEPQDWNTLQGTSCEQFLNAASRAFVKLRHGNSSKQSSGELPVKRREGRTD